MNFQGSGSRIRLQNCIADVHARVLRKLSCDPVMPLAYWLAVRNVLRLLSLHGPGLVQPSYEESIEELGISVLQESLRGHTLGGWKLDSSTIRFLWRTLDGEHPTTILEFGSGISTVMLAHYASVRNSPATRVVSLEQNEWAVNNTRALLAERGLDSCARVLHAPVTEYGIYQADFCAIQDAFGGCKPTWVLIDGPLGPAGCRVHTLLQYGRLCASGARWFLDDAFRNGELSALARWNKTPGVSVSGIYPIGKGLATGVICEPERIPVSEPPIKAASVG